MALKAGPKVRGDLKPLPPAQEPVTWLENVTGELYPWQRDLIAELSGSTRPRGYYAQIARKNGKSRAAACLALAEICLKERRHVYAVSDSVRSLDSVLTQELRDIIGASELRDSLWVFKDRIECEETGSFIKFVPNKYQSAQGINPHLVLADEVHLLSEEVWSGMIQAGRARPDFLLLGVTTPGYDLTSHAHALYQRVKAGTMAGTIYEADPALPLDDRDNWKCANPLYDHLPSFADALEYDYAHLTEHEFRRFALGQWTATASAWLPYGKWDSLAIPAELPPPGTRVYLGFDGSYSGDSTALVGCTHEGHLFVVNAWEKPGAKEWRVPRDDVMDTVAEAFAHWDVAEMVCDPPYWGREIAEWVVTYGDDRVLALETYSRQRFGPACTNFYSGVMDGRITHDGDPRLARHIANAMVKGTSQGDVIVKADKDSPAKIDLAVAAVLAYSRASTDVATPLPRLVCL